MSKLGLSWFIDFQGVDDDTFHKRETFGEVLQEAAKIGKLTVLQSGDFQFQQQLEDTTKLGGTTIFLLLSESHLSVHTWPEKNQVLVDLFSCGSESDAQKVIDFLIGKIPHTNYVLRKYTRGEIL